jgi:HlyD family type I secretion membrane fusion protein
MRRVRDVIVLAWRNRRHQNSKSRYRSSEADFLAGELSVTEQPTPALPRVTQWVVAGLLATTLVWSVTSKVDVVVLGTGRVLAANNARAVQADASSLVRKVLVRDGDVVEAGQLLIELDKGTLAQDLQQFSYEQEAARIREQAFSFLVDARADALAQFLSDDREAAQWRQDVRDLIARNAEDFLAKRKENLASIDRFAAERDVVKTRIEAARQILSYLELVSRAFGRLSVDGATATLNMREKEQAVREKEAEVFELSKTGDVLQAGYEEAVAKLEATEAQIRLGWLQQVREAEMAAIAATTNLDRTKAQMEKTVIRAPVAGVVKQLKVFGSGAATVPGDVLMTIIPQDRPELVELKIANRDRGQLETGMNVEIKVDAFPFTRHGSVSGTLSHISADSTADTNPAPVTPEFYYTTHVTLTSTEFADTDFADAIVPGMTVVGEVKIGRRTVFSYFLSPIVQGLSEAIREL